jgi:hypothetical protein
LEANWARIEGGLTQGRAVKSGRRMMVCHASVKRNEKGGVLAGVAVTELWVS